MKTGRLLMALLFGLLLALAVGLGLSGVRAAAAPGDLSAGPAEAQGQALPTGATTAWWAAVQETIRRDEGLLSIRDSIADWIATGEGTDNQLGYSVGTAGDVNGDGYGDVVVGAYGYDSSRGLVTVYAGGGGRPLHHAHLHCHRRRHEQHLRLVGGDGGGRERGWLRRFRRRGQGL